MRRVHLHPVRVYFEDTDAGGIAYHATYLRWAERGRTESLRAIGLPHSLLMERHGVVLVVRRIEVEYLRPARLDDLVRVATRVERIRGVSLDLGQDILPEAEDAPLARMKVGLVCVRQADLRPAPIPAEWRAALGG
ncbi:MAG: YbgC/FadM family acyl-CoA thioesterase [Acetobacteraceae bacterium]|nr:YbgC/FadM family acyl-CoA thioesterase [Acetobacteraceae bacterium]MDW8398387.1 YbgC/FadM family acyl-CoA thioesterase [Acetobacteraceae bacterium]